jgi:hypothetical protein
VCGGNPTGVDIRLFQQLSAIRFELQYENVFVAQPADVEIIFERLVVVLQSDSLYDFHWEVVMDTKCPYSVFTRFPVIFARTERGVALVFSDGPRPACRSFKKLISLRFQFFPVLLDFRWVFRFLRRPYLETL